MKVDGIEVTIQSDATKACAELDKMIAKLSQVSSAITSTKSNRLGGKSNITGTTKGLASFISMSGRAKKSTISLASAFGKFYASCFLVIRGVKSLGKAIQSSMDYIETYNYYNVIMGKLGNEFSSAWAENGYNSAEEYANSFTERLNELTQKMSGFRVGKDGGLSLTSSIGLGIDPNVLMNFETQITSITNSLGLCAETSIDTSKALTMLAADMSSLRNIDLEDVMTNLQSGLIGQARALYKYGIDITNATLQTYAYKYGLEKSVSEMTQAEKMQLRLLAILDQSKVAWGDMANTVSTAANQYRILKQQVSNLARMLGNLFLPIVAKVLPYINALVISLQHLFTWFGKMLGLSTKDLMDGISSGYTDSGLDTLGDSADDVTNSLDDASKAANKLKNSVLGIDELNVLNPSDTSSSVGGSIGGSIDLSDTISDALEEYESVWDIAIANMENKAQAIADRIISAFKKGDFGAIGEFIGTSISDKLSDIEWDSVYESVTKFASGLANFLNGLISPELFASVASTIAGALNTKLTAFFVFGDTFDWENLGNSIVTGVNTFFENFDFVKLGETLNTWVDGLKTALGTALVNTDWSTVLVKIADLFKTLDIDTITVIVGAWAIKMYGGALVNAAFKSALMKKIGTSTLAIAIPVTIYIKFYEMYMDRDKFFQEFTGPMAGLMSHIYGASEDEMLKYSYKYGRGIGGLLMGDFTTDELLSDLSKSISNIWSFITKTCALKWLEITTWWNNTWTSWLTSDVESKFSLTTWTDMMSNIPIAFLNIFESAIKVAMEILSPFIDFVSSVFDGINPNFDFESVTKKAGANINLKAKGFATGGFPDTADLFYANENGVPELVGSIGGRTAVASGAEITGISDAVYNTAEAEMQLLREQNALLRQLLNKNPVNITDRDIARANIRGQRSMGLQVRTT